MRKLAGWVSLVLCVCGLDAVIVKIKVEDVGKTFGTVNAPQPTVGFVQVEFITHWSQDDHTPWVSKQELNNHLHPPVPDIIYRACVFPFMYGDVIYYNCISAHSDFAWCSLDKKFQGRWRYCTGSDPPRCIFPFSYNKQRFYKCIKEGYFFNRSWCSLTENYDEDGKWKQCSPYNL